jgi:hypothetical protein
VSEARTKAGLRAAFSSYPIGRGCAILAASTMDNHALCVERPPDPIAQGWQDGRSGQIRMNDADQFLRRARRLALGFSRDNLLADMILNNFGNEAIHGPSARCGLLEQLGAGCVLFDDRALQCVQLATDATKSLHKLCFFNLYGWFLTCSHTRRGISTFGAGREVSCFLPVLAHFHPRQLPDPQPC